MKFRKHDSVADSYLVEYQHQGYYLDGDQPMLKPLIVVLCLAVGTLSGQSPELRSNDGKDTFLGTVNFNRYDPDSIANPYGRYGSKYSPNSVNNPFGRYGSAYSPYSATNPYATSAPTVVSPAGNYLGDFSANPYAPNSTANPYGTHGSRYSPTSINNPYGRFGSRYSPNGVANPYGTGSNESKRTSPRTGR